MLMTVALMLLSTSGYVARNVGIEGLWLNVIEFASVFFTIFVLMRPAPMKVFFLFVLPMSLGFAALVIILHQMLGIDLIVSLIISLAFGTGWFYVSKNAYNLMLEYLRVRA